MLEMPLPDRWEHGSEFHLLTYSRVAVVSGAWPANGIFYGSGRDAFRALVRHGKTTRGWQRLWLPSYYCQDVVASFLNTGIKVGLYPDGPNQAESDLLSISLRPGDVVLRVNFFGLRSKPLDRHHDHRGVEFVDDHSHDPWSAWAMASDADWCVASLRKTLPVPDGGLLWSPLGHTLPVVDPVSSEHEQASLEKFTASVLKDLYLKGYPIEKDTFRRLAISGERHLVATDISGMVDWSRSVLPTFPVFEWRECRRLNHRTLSAVLEALTWVTVLQPSDHAATCPFSSVLIFDTADLRAHVRQRLIESRVYPAILWPLDEPLITSVRSEHIDFSQRMLSVHCDMRYDKREMEHVGALIRQFGEEYLRA